MADDIIALAEGFRAQLIHADAQAIMAMSRAWTGVEAALQTAVGDLAQQIADLKAKGEEVPQWKLWQMSQYQSLLAQIAGEMGKYSQGAIADIQDEQIKAQQLAAKHAKQMLTAALAGQRSLGTAFDKLPAGAVENITAIAQAGQPLNKLLENAYPTAVAGLTRELIYGTAVGRNPRETARVAIRKGLAQGLNHILLVARDQQIRNYREMVRQRYKASGVVYGYMRLAARNTRTCLACIALDGTIYDTGQVMAMHPQDRCSMIPLVEGFPLPNVKPASEWFKTLDEDEQRRMMGDGRYEAWRDGLFDFRQVVTVGNHPVWGPSAHVTSLTDLLGGKGGLGGAPIDPAALLKTHQAAKPAKPKKPQTLEVDKGDKKLLEQLINDLAQAPIDAGTYKAIEGALSKVLAGQQGMAYTDADGRLEGALAYEVKSGNLNFLQITAAGFANAAANKKAIVDVAAVAQQKGQGLQLYVPNSHQALYKEWGFTIHQPLKGGAQMRLSPDDVGGFLKDPDGYGQVKAAQLATAAQEALADPHKAFTFRSGQEIAGLPFKPVQMTDADFLAQTKALPNEEPLLITDPQKHAAAGMLLFTPDGKLVVVDPAGQYGGYKTTFPKGTQEEGMSLQATAVKEVWEETGYKARILGHLGDYEKATSVNRFYIGVVEDGAPWAAHYETEAVRIVPLDQVDALLNVGTDKGIFQDLLKLKDEALAGKPFSIADLEAGLDKLAQPPIPTVPPLPDGVKPTKTNLVAHLVAETGAAKWKLSVMTADNVQALIGQPVEHVLQAAEAAGAAHTAKYSQPAAAKTEPAINAQDQQTRDTAVTADVDEAGVAVDVSDPTPQAAVSRLKPHKFTGSFDDWGKHYVGDNNGRNPAQWEPLKKAWAKAGLGALEELPRLFDVEYKDFSIYPDAITYDPEDEGELLSVMADIFDASGAKIGHMSRTYDLENKSVYHSVFVIDDGKAQGTGLGTAWEAAAEAAYVKMGFEKIKLEASNTAGGYVWARMGFDFDPQASGNWGKNGKAGHIYKKLFDLHTARYGSPPDDPQSLARPWEIAAFTGPDGYKIGKEALLGTTWTGIKYLNEDDPGYRAGQAYFAAVGATKAVQPPQATAGVGAPTPTAPKGPPTALEKFLQTNGAGMTVKELDEAWQDAAYTSKQPVDVLDKIYDALLAAKKQVKPTIPDPPRNVKADSWLLAEYMAKQLPGKFAPLEILGKLSPADMLALVGQPPSALEAAMQPGAPKPSWGTPAPPPPPPPTAVTKLPPPPEDPATLSKKALVEHLAQIRGIAKWKLTVATKDQVAALFDMPEAEALAAIDAFGAAHAAKYGKKGASTPAQPPPPAVPPGAAAFAKYQQDATSLNAEEAKLALEYAQAEGYSKVVLFQLKEQYQKQIGDPLITGLAPGGTKEYLVNNLKTATGLPIYLLNKLKKDELAALLDQPMSAAYTAVGKPYTPTAAAPPPASQPTAVAAPPPKAPEPPPPADPVDMKTWPGNEASYFMTNLSTSFTPGSPGAKGVSKILDNLKLGHSGFAYHDDDGFAVGAVTFKKIDADTMKVSGAAFTDTAVNQKALADVANVALSQGLKLQTYVPQALLPTYKKWGFTVDSTIGNGAYVSISPGNIPAFVTATGKKPKSAPKPAEKQAQAQATAAATTLGFPAGVGKHTAMKLTHPALVAHLAQASGLAESKLTKYTKAMLVQFMEMPKDQAVALLQKGSPPPPPAPPPVAPKAAPVAKKKALPTNLPPFALPDPPGFPASVGSLKTVSSLGGSTGAKLVEDPATGKRYVLKKGNSAGHLREEAYADAAYQALGLNVPTFKVYDTADGPVKLAEFKSGLKTLGEALNSATPAERKAIVAEVRKGFAADALMGNWDVIGASKDNILVGDDGKVWRIDNGGSFRYRAQGAKKEKEFLTDYPVELWTLRDKKVGPENAQIFGDLDIYEIMDQARGVVDKGEALLAAVPDELRPLVHGRLEVMRDLVGTSDTFKDDKWQAGYTDGFLQQSTYIRREGLIDVMPQQMKQAKMGSTTVYDEEGRKFDVLRGKDSHVEAWAAYCKANGGDPEIISHWMGKQAGSSWSTASQALKYKIATERGGSFDSYYWHDGLGTARDQYEAAIKKAGKETYDKTWAMWHAWVYESLRHMEFTRKKGSAIELVRTEGENVMKAYGVKMGAHNVIMRRGAAESGSIYRAKRIVAGGEVTRQVVPIHRILGYYWSDRPGHKNNEGGFLGDGENEFVFIPEGIPFDYIDKVDWTGKGVEAYW